MNTNTHLKNTTFLTTPIEKPGYDVNSAMKIYVEMLGKNSLRFEQKKLFYILEQATKFLLKTPLKPHSVVFLGTRPHLFELTKVAGYKTAQNYLSSRWIPGLLTNWLQKKPHLQYYRNLDTYFKYLRTGKVSKLQNTLETKHVTIKNYFRMHKDWEGMLHLVERPKLLIILDAENQAGAIREAYRAGVPTIALTNLKTDPRLITYPLLCDTDNLEHVIFYTDLLARLLRTKR